MNDLLRELRAYLLNEEEREGPWPEDAYGRELISKIDAALAAPTAKGGTEVRDADSILAEACEPWSFAAGDPPDYDSPLHQVFVAGMIYAEKLLAGFLDVESYESGDGSEDFDADATMSLQNILTAAGLYDPEDGRRASLSSASPPPPSGAAGGGSGDLGALSAGADHEFKSHPSVFWPAATGEKTFEYRRDDRGGYSVGQTVRLRCYDPATGYVDTPPLDRRITNILRGGEFELPDGFCILSLAPTPDLGAQGEPVAWAYEYEHRGRWCPSVSPEKPTPRDWIRNIRPLYEALAAPRTGSGVSVEEIAAVLWSNRHTRYSGIKFETAKSFGATYSQSDFKASVAAVYEEARAILALFAQAPRDGGETQGGAVAEAIAALRAIKAIGLRNRLKAPQPEADWKNAVVQMEREAEAALTDLEAPAPPSGVETIRQDSEGATDE